MKHYLGEVGTDIILNCGTDISAASTVSVKYTKPDGTTGSWTGTKYNSNYIKYTLLANDINVAGRWLFQAYIVSALWTGYGETCEMYFSALFDNSVLTTLQKVKTFLRLTTTQTTDDALIENLIFENTKKIQVQLNRDIFYGTYTEYYDGDGTNILRPKQFPIVSVTSLYDDTGRVFAATSLIASTDYVLDSTSRFVMLDSSTFTRWMQNIKIVYTAGYKQVPEDLELACIQMVAADYIEMLGGLNAMEGETITYKPSNLRKQASLVLDRYTEIV